MYDAYARIFTRMGLKFRAVAADTGADRRQRVARIPGARRFRRGRDRVVPGVRLRGERRAGRGARARARRARRRPKRCRRCRRRAWRPARKSRQLLRLPLARTVKCIMLAVDAEGGRRACCMLLIRGDHALNEVKVSKIPGLDEVPLGDASRDRRRDRLQARLSRPGRHPEGPAADRRSLGRRDGRLRLRRQRAGLSPARRQLRPRLPRARPRRRHPQRGRRRSVARRQGHARDPARHRGRPRVRAGHLLFAGDGCNLSRRRRSSRRSWKWAATASASPASSPRPSSRTTTQRASSGRSRSRRSRSPSRRSATTATTPSATLADRLHDELEAAGVEVLLDDRGERPGVMFADLELIGIPHRVTIGERGLKEGKVEYQGAARHARRRRCRSARSPPSFGADFGSR